MAVPTPGFKTFLVVFLTLYVGFTEFRLFRINKSVGLAPYAATISSLNVSEDGDGAWLSLMRTSDTGCERGCVLSTAASGLSRMRVVAEGSDVAVRAQGGPESNAAVVLTGSGGKIVILAGTDGPKMRGFDKSGAVVWSVPQE